MGKALSYTDDVLLYTEDPMGQEMVKLIKKFLDTVLQSRGKICMAKSKLLRTEVKYLGFVVGRNGILMDPKYRQALTEFPPPKSPKALARFLGMVQYYKHFLKNLSKDAADLHKLKGENFSKLPDWAKKDFAKIKQSLLDLEALAAPKFTTLQKNPVIVGLDFSTKAIGVTLTQVQHGKDHQEHQRLLYCFGRKNTESGKNYSSHKGEIGAFVWAGQMSHSRMSQEGGKKEKQNGGWTVVRDNQLPERREVRGEVEQPSTLEMEVEADRAVEKELGPIDVLLRAG